MPQRIRTVLSTFAKHPVIWSGASLSLFMLAPWWAPLDASRLAKVQPAIFVQGQSSSGDIGLTFDVISIRKSPKGAIGMTINSFAGSYTGRNITVRDLIQSAYSVKPTDIVGLPRWVDQEHFDIKAKIVDRPDAVLKNITAEQTRIMLKALLADHFFLRTHYEPRVMPSYDLVPDKDLGKLLSGSQSTTSTSSERNVQRGAVSIRPGHIEGRVGMALLTTELSLQVGRPVIDKTGATGVFSMSLSWNPNLETSGDSDLPDIYGALRSQLGLRLKPSEATVRVLVVDALQEPALE